jgi:hypothetical protein
VGEAIIAGHVEDFSGWFVSARERLIREPSLRTSET